MGKQFFTFTVGTISFENNTNFRSQFAATSKPSQVSIVKGHEDGARSEQKPSICFHTLILQLVFFDVNVVALLTKQ